ncbi:replication protein [Acinetobacter guillouiae]|uniref:replication protein n=1 Tax=Acinetobacter guillouiae TaxID=106649 RepID=UPI003AF43AD0
MNWVLVKNLDTKKKPDGQDQASYIQNEMEMNMKTNLAYRQEIDNEITLHPSTAKKIERQAMSKKEEGYTRTPNALIDDQIMAQLKDKAFKCLMFIVRQTIGFDRASHTIAITQFQKYCGIKKRDTVMSSIGELEDAKLISVVRKTGCLNEYFLTLNQYQQTGLVPFIGSTTKRDGTSTSNGDGTSTVERDTIKETLKENIKETHTIENSPEILDDSWKPNLTFLKTILVQTKFSQQTDQILSLTDFNFHLGNFNAHWENKINLTENQRTRKFAAWLIQEFEKHLNKAERATKQKTKPNLNVNDAWDDIPQFSGQVEHVEIPEDFI